MNAHLSLASTVGLVPRRAGLCAGQGNTVDVLVRIQAPDAPTGHGAQRPPQALALVIDRSGSMSGRPLEEAKRCAEYVLGKLRPSDAVALVKFDNRVQRLGPAAPLGDGAHQRAAIAGISRGRQHQSAWRMERRRGHAGRRLRPGAEAGDPAVGRPGQRGCDRRQRDRRPVRRLGRHGRHHQHLRLG